MEMQTKPHFADSLIQVWQARALTFLGWFSVFVTLGVLVFALVRAPDDPVAAEISFEALRVAHGWPLYVAPEIGAWEMGAPPARYFVLYTPVFSWLIGKLTALFFVPSLAKVHLVGRALAFLSWVVIQVVPVITSPLSARRNTTFATVLAVSLFFLSRNSYSMSPDTFASMFVCLGVVRAVRVGHVDSFAAALVAMGPFVKPSCLGAAVGVAIVLLLRRHPGWWRAVLSGLGVVLVLAAFSHIVSRGLWITHIISSTGQPLGWVRWTEQFGSRSVFLGIPHGLVAYLAWRRRVAWEVLGPLVSSVLWCCLMMSKHGSGTHYWIEPSALAIVAVASMPLQRTPTLKWRRHANWFAHLASLFLVLLCSARYWAHSIPEFSARRSRIELLKNHCNLGPGQFFVSSDASLELELNGRLSVPSWQSAFLVRKGTFPLEAWKSDLLRPEVQWLGLGGDIFAPRANLDQRSNDESVEEDPYREWMTELIRNNYIYDANVGGVFVFKRRVRTACETSVRTPLRSDILRAIVSPQKLDAS